MGTSASSSRARASPHSPRSVAPEALSPVSSLAATAATASQNGPVAVTQGGRAKKNRDRTVRKTSDSEEQQRSTVAIQGDHDGGPQDQARSQAQRHSTTPAESHRGAHDDEEEGEGDNVGERRAALGEQQRTGSEPALAKLASPSRRDERDTEPQSPSHDDNEHNTARHFHQQQAGSRSGECEAGGQRAAVASAGEELISTSPVTARRTPRAPRTGRTSAKPSTCSPHPRQTAAQHETLHETDTAEATPVVPPRGSSPAPGVTAAAAERVGTPPHRPARASAISWTRLTGMQLIELCSFPSVVKERLIRTTNVSATGLFSGEEV